MKRTLICMAAFGLAACDVPSGPVVTDYNEASVKIQESTLWSTPDPKNPEVVEQAERICASTNRTAEYASTVANPQNYTATHLFLCLRA